VVTGNDLRSVTKKSDVYRTKAVNVVQCTRRKWYGDDSFVKMAKRSDAVQWVEDRDGGRMNQKR